MRLVPAERFQSAVEMREALRAALAALPATAPTNTAQARPPNATRPAPLAPATAGPSTASPRGTIRCPRCGHLNRRTAKFCARDGAPLPGAAAARSNGRAASNPVPATQVVGATTTADLHARRATEAFGAGRFMQAVQQGEAAVREGH